MPQTRGPTAKTSGGSSSLVFFLRLFLLFSFSFLFLFDLVFIDFAGGHGNGVSTLFKQDMGTASFMKWRLGYWDTFPPLAVLLSFAYSGLRGQIVTGHLSYRTFLESCWLLGLWNSWVKGMGGLDRVYCVRLFYCSSYRPSRRQAEDVL
jgi:hypothetical protein